MVDYLGQQLGSYRLLHLLGQGGFAEVYLGEHVRLGMKAAVKVLHTRLAGDEEIHAFQQEARIIADLKHPHIVRILDFDVQKGTPFLVLDYASNGSLRQKHSRGTRLPLTLVINYVTQIASALQYAHDRKLIHRDVKPENMLVSEQEAILLSDFGIATIAHSTSSMSTQTSSGTLAYMAPEQIQGKPRKESDQYALAVTVYQWLCGQPPFQGSSTEMIAQHLAAAVPPLRSFIPDLPMTIEQVVLKALAKDPKERFESVQEFALALGQESGDGKISLAATPISISQQNVLPGNIPLVAPTTPARPTLSPSMYQQTKGTLLYTVNAFQPVRAVAWSPNGMRIASAGDDKIVRVWDARTGKLLVTYRGHLKEGAAYTLTWSPDGTRIASAGSNGTIRIWSADTGKNLSEYRGHSDSVGTLAWSPDGAQIASGGKDQAVHIWSASAPHPVLIFREHFDAIYAVAWSPDGRSLASGSKDHTVYAWDITTGNRIFQCRFSAAVVTVAWSPDGRSLAAAGLDKAVHILDAATARELSSYHGHTGNVHTARWSPNGASIASGGSDKTVQIWAAATGKLSFTYRGHAEAVLTMAWSPDGIRIASGGSDKTVQVWQAI